MEIKIEKVTINCTYQDKEAELQFPDADSAMFVLNNRKNIKSIKIGDSEEPGVGDAIIEVITQNQDGQKINKKPRGEISPSRKDEEQPKEKIREADIEQPKR